MCDPQALLERITRDARQILGTCLVGVYVHGSLAMDCFTWERSDVDYLLVVERTLIWQEKTRLLRRMVEQLPCAPPKGLEMSVMLRSACNPFVHPAPYDLHFSMDHLALLEQSPGDYLKRMQGVDPDLAAHCTVLHHRGYALWGPPVDEIFGPVDPADYLDSIWLDVQGAQEEILENPVYVALNLCRVLAYLEEGRVLSKKEGGEWGRDHLPPRWRPLLQGALAAYRGEVAPGPDPREAVDFAGSLLDIIREKRAAREVAH